MNIVKWIAATFLLLILIFDLIACSSKSESKPFPPQTSYVTITVTSPPITTTAPPLTITEPPVTITINPSSTVLLYDFPIVTIDDLAYYLIVNFGRLNTSTGVTYFTFDIIGNDSSIFPYDYWIQVKYDFQFFYDLQYSNKITTEMNHIVCQELKNHQEKLAKAAISVMPGKKFYGGYYDSWYRYPELEIDLITRHYYSWTNYQPPSILTSYYEAIISDFSWYDFIDDELER